MAQKVTHVITQVARRLPEVTISKKRRQATGVNLQDGGV